MNVMDTLGLMGVVALTVALAVAAWFAAWGLMSGLHGLIKRFTRMLRKEPESGRRGFAHIAWGIILLVAALVVVLVIAKAKTG